jgi:nickel/cobalt exporter
MKKLILLCAGAMAALALAPASASAHPLGNFSVNHLAQVSVSSDRVDVRYVLDEAEIPTFQHRDVPDAELLARTRAEVERRLALSVDGRRVALRPAGRATIAHPGGQGGLPTTRVELPLRAVVSEPDRVELRDGTYPGRVGWKAIVARPGRGTDVRSSAPKGDPTNGLRAYPEDLLQSPADLREARFDVAPGTGTLSAPDGSRTTAGTPVRRADEGLTKVFGDAAAGKGVLVLLLLAAFGWGAVHALSPGHGKAMVAAYLVGTRGTPRQAVALGGIVTATHTAGVFALGGITLALSAYVLPETLYPWLNLISGVLVVAIGAAVLRSNLRRRQALRQPARSHGHDHGHHHGRDHLHGHHHHDHGHHHHGHHHGHGSHHDHGPQHDHGPHAHGHGHHHDHQHGHHHHHGHGHHHEHGHARHHQPAPSRLRRGWRRVVAAIGGHHHHHDGDGHDHHHHHLPEQPGWRGLLAMGAAAGLIPCPSALVVLLGAIAQGEVALGMLLIVAFSAGLATTLTALGLAVVLATRFVRRVRVPAGIVTALPAASAVVIVGVGCVLTARALPLVGG